MYQINELSVTLEYKKVKIFANKNGKFGDLPTELLENLE